MGQPVEKKMEPRIKEPKGLSPRIAWLRDYFFKGVSRPWNNEFTSWTTGTPWDVIYDECNYYIVPESYAFLQTFSASLRQAARPVPLHPKFWSWSLPERRAWFIREVMARHVPKEILPGDLLCGARFNIQASRCWTKKEARERGRILNGKKGARAKMRWFHDNGYGNAGATAGHLIPDYERVVKFGWKAIHTDLKEKYRALSGKEKRGEAGGQLRAMISASTMARDVASGYAALARQMAARENSPERKDELLQMAANCARVPWEPPETFWEAVQAVWMTHMLVMSDENYPGPGVSFGRLDQYLLPHWEKSLAKGMDREFGKEVMKCFWVHANTAYDAMIRTGANQGISAGFGQLITLAGMGADGSDMANDLTYAMLEVVDDMSPILEPKPNVRLHRNTPEALLDKVVDMIETGQGAPFLLNFDERSMAGMMREARMGGYGHLIRPDNVFNYAAVGCLENTMQGNDRSGTVDVNVNLLKAVELALAGGRPLVPYVDPIMGKTYKSCQHGPETGDALEFASFEDFFSAYAEQTRHIIQKAVDLYEITDAARARFGPTPYLSCLVRGCAEKRRDITQGGAEINFVTLEAVTYATTVDSLLAIKYLVYDTKTCTMETLVRALKDNWAGHEVLQAKARFKAPKYGRDDDEADALARRVMDLWTEEAWRHRTITTLRRFRPGMLSWNYWVGDGYVLPASPDGRPKGQFLSNAICPTNGADIKGPTSNTNSVGKSLGGRSLEGPGDWEDYLCSLPNGASHTMTFNPSILRDPEHREKFKAFLRGYVENGGTALQINMLDAGLLKEAQENPTDYRHLLVRVTGYNAYFTSIGKELQDEVIARLSHEGF